ncbi:MAG: hypothetical protein VB108_10520 [Anaerolineaceae bacterium]|nr:hypothetical protein [Anaerolineaceae bacterium]
MKLQPASNPNYLRDFFLIEAGMAGWFLFDNIHQRDKLFFAFVGLFFLSLLLMALFWPKKKQPVNQIKPKKGLKAAFFLSALLITLLILAFFLLKVDLFAGRSLRLFILVSLAGLLSFLLAALGGKTSPYLYFAGLLLWGGFLYRVGVFVPQVQANPFALGWSEGSRYYSASAYFAQEIYGMKIPLSVLDPSRGLLQAIPFMIKSNAILFHRLWLAGLWLGLTAWAAWLFVERLRTKVELKPVWLFFYFFLFFFQGAIYFHLLPVLILVLLGFKPSQPLHLWFFLILASIWAGLSRINWLPVPALMMTILYLLDVPLRKNALAGYLSKPALWVLVGTGLAFLSKRAYVALSGENPAFFDSAFSSSLLWNRLLPNPTFVPGIIPGILLLCLPLLALLVYRFGQGLKHQLHPLRLLGMAAILFVFFLGGVVVSTKIGGGGDLHNLDAFIVLFGLSVSNLVAGAFIPENAVQKTIPAALPAFWLLAAALLPVFFAFQTAPQWRFDSSSNASSELGKLNRALQLVEQKGGSVLFISNRQLQTFHLVPQFTLIPQYEKDFLMEMAMAKNTAYLQSFRSDLKSGQITAVLVDQLNTAHQDSSHSFGEENNAWVDEVLLPLLEYYEPAYSVNEGNVNLLVNKNAPGLIEALKTLQNGSKAQ